MRGKILDEAKAIINGERQDQYGDPENAFIHVSNFWSAFLSMTISPRQAAMMMTLFKLAREIHGSKRDNLVDAIGYLALASDMEDM